MHDGPISPASPWYYFSPEGIGSLAFREWMGETICTEDVQRVVDANPQSVSDERLAAFVARVFTGEIKPRKIRRGRPKADRSGRLFLYYTHYETRRHEIKAMQCRGELPKPLPSFLSPCQQAAEDVAREWRLPFDWRTFANWLSLEKKKVMAHSERSRAFFVKERLRHS